MFLISLTGIPVSAGFVGKFYLFGAAVGAGYVALAVVGVVMSVVSAYYYLRVVVSMYMSEPAGRGLLGPQRSLGPAVPPWPLAGLARPRLSGRAAAAVDSARLRRAQRCSERGSARARSHGRAGRSSADDTLGGGARR